MAACARKKSGVLRWLIILILLLAAGMFYVVNHPAIVGAAATTRQLPIYCVQRDQKVLSISFDAAWGDDRLRPLGDGRCIR